MSSDRYFKGKYKLERISPKSETNTALYRALEDGENWKKGDLIIIPVRICWKNKKAEGK